MNINVILDWAVPRAIALLVGGVVLFLTYRLLEPAIHRVVPGLLRVEQATVSGAAADELAKRSVTLEELLSKLLRAGILLAAIVLVLAVLDLWAVLAGLGLILAALTVASQDVVLDYVMGLLILVEGQYFKGDWIALRASAGGIEGEVLEVGLRRTILRDSLGVVHSISNGLIRISSNLTRVFSVAMVEIHVVHARDVDRALSVAARVGAELGTDDAWKDRLADDTTDVSIAALTLDAATIRLQRRVVPGVGGAVSAELRRRLTAALVAESIETIRGDATAGPSGA
ncbi:MAG TPA: mechanosensitive ion channel family protein, partial [Candidatus Binatia bacterium]|nr:mechanosensitive ion channel family protein [Candidatus Binatia bacterium]